MTETIIICTLFGVFIFASFIVGLHYGSKIGKNEKVELPNLNPIRAVSNYIDGKKAEAQHEREELIEEINLANIDAYDGTGNRQRSFPK